MRVIFLGTPDFAVASLEALVLNAQKTKQYEIVAVVTMPDKPAGRGNKIATSPVKDCALRHNIPLLQPEKLKSKKFLTKLKSYKADLQIVVAFRMLPESVWNMPRLGTFNLHGSLLPQYRGAAPINWAIINGEHETGVSTFFLQHEIDTGKIIFQYATPILLEDTLGTVYEKLKNNGALLVIKTLEAIQNGVYPQIPQDLSQESKPAPKIFHETCEVNWRNLTRLQAHNLVRGLAPYPSAWTKIDGKNYKIHQTNPNFIIPNQVVAILENAKDYLTDNKSFLAMTTTDGWIAIEQIQAEGKKAMPIQAFLAGNKFT